ncbi:hypothetical protein HYDPIDRAFT_40011 [Hydnomerulius pinastri MD-312]|uniref:Uncharacterized protein n=1 Tax=Hydnomerulius pinastri MD-312 TaxID=994086 RepID=A0A0C9WG50_9AGAM|nr:hypothetical protein HYDPIDRAFT_40011 [Hydnomerulius pinastri MD-312]
MSDSLDIPPAQIYAEGTWLQGAIVTAILYGIVVVLYVMCTRSLWSRIRSRDVGHKKNVFFLCYVTFVFALGTIYVAFNTDITQLGFINNRNYPGGPSVFEENTSSPPLNVAFVLSNWCADVLMIWRCIVVYRDTKFHALISGFGILMFIASVGMFSPTSAQVQPLTLDPGSASAPPVTGSLWVVIVSRPAQSGSGWMSFSFLFPYLSVSLAINIFISILTVLRLMYHRSRISKVLGPGHGTIYASFAAMVVESASVYSICSLLYLIPYAVNSPLANSFMQILGEAQIIAPLLIIYRVSEGKAWTREYSTHPTTSASLRMRRISNQPPPIHGSSHQRSNTLNVEVTFDVTRHSDREGSVKFAKDEELGANDV